MANPRAVGAMIGAADAHRNAIRQLNDRALATGAANHQSALVACLWEARRMLELEPQETRAILRGICQNYLESNSPLTLPPS